MHHPARRQHSRSPLWPTKPVASEFEIHPIQITTRIMQAKQALPQIFTRSQGKDKRNSTQRESELFEQFGRLKMELE